MCLNSPLVQAYTFELYSPLSLGEKLASKTQAKRFIVDEFVAFTDSENLSESTESASYDRYISNQLYLSATHFISPKLFASVDLITYSKYEKYETNGSSKTLGSGLRNDLKMAASVFFDISSQLYLVGGFNFYQWLSFDYTTENSAAKVKDHYEAASAKNMFIGLVKNGSASQGGVYYSKGMYAARGFSRSSDSLEIDIPLIEDFYIAPMLMFFVNFTNKSYDFKIEVANLLYSHLNEELKEDFAYEDRARVLFSAKKNLITIGASFLDSSYSKQEKINASSIARYGLFSSLDLLWLEAGVFASYGADTQSLEETNNKLSVFQVGANLKWQI